MSLKKYFLLFGLATAFCWTAWILVLFYINPTASGLLGFIFFYASLLLALIGTLSMIGFGFRFLIQKDQVLYRLIQISSRQAIFLAILMIIVLILQSYRYLFWWNALMLVGLFSLLEIFFISYKKLNSKA